jgi:hypothetical protein
VSIRARTFLIAGSIAVVTVCGMAAPQSGAFSLIPHTSDNQIVLPPRDHPVDFNGNEVRQAVARYKIDLTGALYEEHSPDTEVPRLRPPKG